MSWPALAAVTALVAVLYARGLRRRSPWRMASFAGGTALLVLVLSPPFDRAADTSLTVHMLQHVVLVSFVPPLVVLAAPWLPLWRGLPLGLRRAVARRLLALRPLLRLAEPWPAWLLINVDLAVWHVPALYDLTLRSEPAHALEHATFLVFGVLFWLAVIDSPPFHARLDELRRALYVTAGAATGWLLALVLTFDPTPLYGAYAALPHRWGGFSALADQQLAAGVMIGIGAIPYTIAVFVHLYRWLDESRLELNLRQI